MKRLSVCTLLCSCIVLSACGSEQKKNVYVSSDGSVTEIHGSIVDNPEPAPKPFKEDNNSDSYPSDYKEAIDKLGFYRNFPCSSSVNGFKYDYAEASDDGVLHVFFTYNDNTVEVNQFSISNRGFKMKTDGYKEEYHEIVYKDEVGVDVTFLGSEEGKYKFVYWRNQKYRVSIDFGVDTDVSVIKEFIQSALSSLEAV